MGQVGSYFYPVAPTLSAQSDDLGFFVGDAITEALELQPGTQEGTIVGGGYNPTEGTASMLFMDTYSILGDDGPLDIFIEHPALACLTTQPGDLYGPTGDERTFALTSPHGYGLLYRHGSDDSPQPPPGERWILHKNVASQGYAQAVYDGGAKFTNDGPTTGDGLGGTRIGYQGALTQQVTNSGHQVTLNDTTKSIYTVTASGMAGVYNDTESYILHAPVWNGGGYLNGGSPTLYTLVDAAGQFSGVANSISHVIPSGGIVALGALAGSLTPSVNATARYTDMQNAIQDQITQMIGNGFIQLITTIQALGGTFGTLTPAALLTSLESGFSGTPSFFALLTSLHGITVPECSQKVLTL